MKRRHTLSDPERALPFDHAWRADVSTNVEITAFIRDIKAQPLMFAEQIDAFESIPEEKRLFSRESLELLLNINNWVFT